MKIAEIGNKFRNVTSIDYNSNQTFIEFDALIISLPELMKDFFNHPKKDFFDKRKDILNEFLIHRDIPLILFTPSPGEFQKNNTKYTYSYFLPVDPFELEIDEGKDFNIVPNTIFNEFLQKYKNAFRYQAFFTKKIGQTIAETLFTKKPLAFYNNNSIFLPSLYHLSVSEEQEFLNQLIEIAKKVRKQNDKKELPKWANLYFLPNEFQLNTELNSIDDKINKLEKQKEEKVKQSEEYKNYKRLFTASGNELENEVEELFKQMGFEVLEKETNRDDLILKYKETIAVVEIKGVTGSSAEKHAAQLEKWVSGYYELNEIKPKGILLVNSYRELEIKNRKEQTFPHQMLRFSIQREHCLMTTIQLLGVFYSIKNNPENREQIIQGILNTNGIYNEFSDWKEYIETAETESKSSIEIESK